MPWGDSFVSGLRTGSDIRNAKKDRADKQAALDRHFLEQAAERSLRRELLDKNLAASAPLTAAQAANLNASANRTTTLTPAEFDEIQARTRGLNASAGRTETLTPYEAQDLQASTRGKNALASRTETLTPYEVADLDASTAKKHSSAALDLAAEQLHREKAKRGMEAEVTQSIGPGAEAKFSIPISEAQKQATAAAHQSPYADRIAQLGDKIAENEAELSAGDTRTGLFNLRSRKDEVTKATRQRVRLQALEIQEQLRNGLIDDAEAERRSGNLLKSFR